MARTVGIGHQDFETIRKKGYFYVDKTNFIKEWWESGDRVSLITRPRRFGKTLNMSMTEQFFSVSGDQPFICEYQRRKLCYSAQKDMSDSIQLVFRI